MVELMDGLLLPENYVGPNFFEWHSYQIGNWSLKNHSDIFNLTWLCVTQKTRFMNAVWLSLYFPSWLDRKIVFAIMNALARIDNLSRCELVKRKEKSPLVDLFFCVSYSLWSTTYFEEKSCLPNIKPWVLGKIFKFIDALTKTFINWKKFICMIYLYGDKSFQIHMLKLGLYPQPTSFFPWNTTKVMIKLFKK